MRRTAEPLTIAYIAKGVHAYLQRATHDASFDAMSEKYEGEMGLMGEAINFAGDLDGLADACEEPGGVFLYEVAEPFGEWFAEHAHLCGMASVYDSAVWDKMRALISEWEGN